MERLGIYKGWVTEKTIIKWIDSSFAKYEPRWVEDLHQLKAYANGENPFSAIFETNQPALPPYFFHVSSVMRTVGQEHATATKIMFSHQESALWMPLLAKLGGYEYWRTRIEHRATQSTRGRSFGVAMSTLSRCLYLGWIEQSKALAFEILLLYRQRLFSDVDGEFSKPLYHWLLRICLDYWGWEFDGWGKGFYSQAENVYVKPECFSEAVLNKLFEHWRDEDLMPVYDQLIWLCDYYTHRTKESDYTEFGADLLYKRFPATILAWFRLREQLGLRNPTIAHPLMQPDYAQLPSPQPFYNDELLESVLARLRREEIPDLGEMQMHLSSPPTIKASKGGFLAYLFGRK